MEIEKYSVSVPVNQWVCDYCDQPLGEHAVTSMGNGFAHPECDPLTQILHAELEHVRFGL